MDLSQSLDLTKIQHNTTQMQQQEDHLHKQVSTLKDLLQQYDKAASDFQDFESCIEMLAHLLRNANEDKLTVTQLVQERDEL